MKCYHIYFICPFAGMDNGRSRHKFDMLVSFQFALGKYKYNEPRPVGYINVSLLYFEFKQNLLIGYTVVYSENRGEVSSYVMTSNICT